MIFSELYFPIPANIFHFILLKFIIGVSHQLLGPIAILIAQTDIRHGFQTKQYCKTGYSFSYFKIKNKKGCNRKWQKDKDLETLRNS